MTGIVHPDVRFVAPDTLPWVEGGGMKLRVLRVDIDENIWVIENKFSPGFTAPGHKHTGKVDAFTLSGRWHYLEYLIDYEAGSYVYEPANSVHTLHVPADNSGETHVIFVMQGANLNLDADGNVESVTDAVSILAAYEYMCEAQGFGTPTVLR